MRYIKKIIFVVVFNPIVRTVWRWLMQKNAVSVLLYHDPNPAVIRAHLQYLSKHYNFISYAEFLSGVQTKKSLPPYPVLITLDDGYLQNYSLMEVFKDAGVRPLIFVVSDIIDTQRHFWQGKCEGMEGNNFKRISDSERVKSLRNKGHYHEREYVHRQALSLEEMQEMMICVDFGAHTKSHPILTQCEPDKVRHETEGSKLQLQGLLNSNISSFAYPNGDYSSDIESMVKASGFTSCFTVDAGYNPVRTTDLMRIKRICIGDNDSVNQLKVKSTGLWSLIKERIK